MVDMGEPRDIQAALKKVRDSEVEAFKQSLQSLIEAEAKCDLCAVARTKSETELVPPVCYVHQLARKAIAFPQRLKSWGGGGYF